MGTTRNHLITLVLSLAAAAAAGLTTAIAAAILLAILDLYLCGHGLPTLSQTWIDRGPVQMSWADLIMLTLATMAGVVAGIGVYWARHLRA
ncbi:MAG: hypothetical protein OES79_14730 [Planctomycetota bacterium]|nr:hypothetical protein [Planctomycetota bacterium]